jgi:hypothetical protein
MQLAASKGQGKSAAGINAALFGEGDVVSVDIDGDGGVVVALVPITP